MLSEVRVWFFWQREAFLFFLPWPTAEKENEEHEQYLLLDL